MAKDFETRFREEVYKRKQRQKRHAIRKFSSLFLIFALVVLLVYLLSQENIISQIFNLDIHTILIGIFGLTLITILISYFVNFQEFCTILCNNEASSHDHYDLYWIKLVCLECFAIS